MIDLNIFIVFLFNTNNIKIYIYIFTKYAKFIK